MAGEKKTFSGKKREEFQGAGKKKKPVNRKNRDRTEKRKTGTMQRRRNVRIRKNAAAVRI